MQNGSCRYPAPVKKLHVKEIFYSIAGEGAQVGRASVFVRFSGCNLWSGIEGDREDAKCPFCDTDFRGVDGPNGGIYSGEALVEKVQSMWPVPGEGSPYVVFTGGEPALQLSEELVAEFKSAGFETAIETNGTREIPSNLDWVCVSPKGRESLVVQSGDELKLVMPQDGVDPAAFKGLNFRHYYLQPRYEKDHRHWREVADYCLAHPQWRLSLQNHKELGLK